MDEILRLVAAIAWGLLMYGMNQYLNLPGFLGTPQFAISLGGLFYFVSLGTSAFLRANGRQ